MIVLPDTLLVPVRRPLASRNVLVPVVDREEVQDSLPDASRYVVLLPEVDSVPAIRPERSRKVLLPSEDLFALPVIRPLPSRNVVVLPETLVTPVILPEPSRKAALFPTSVLSFWQGSAKVTAKVQRRMRSPFMGSIDAGCADILQ